VATVAGCGAGTEREMMSDTERIAKLIVKNAHRLEWAMRDMEITLPDVVEVAKAYLQQSGRDVAITGEWLATFCRLSAYSYTYKNVTLRQLPDESWDCWLVGNFCGAIHLGNGFKTRGDVYDLLNGMKIPLKGA